MFLKRAGSIVFLAAAMLAIFLGVMSWGSVQAVSSAPMAITTLDTTLQQGTPMTGTDHTGHNMPEAGVPTTTDEHAGHDMPDATAPGATDGHAGHNMEAATLQAAMPMQDGEGGMGAMMTKMADMQGMMARMQGMMASDMMGGDMPMSADMQKSMGEMMGMMSEMQRMMAEMQGMMAGGMSDMGKMQDQSMGQMGGQQMGGGMMSQMPMMGTMIVVMPMPMHGGMGMLGQMMQGGMDMGKMMGQMPMMQGGMDMGGQGAQGGNPATATKAAAAADPAAAPQTAKLGDIEVKVTPPDLTNIQGETIDFTVDLNATGADLSFDLAKQATLLIGDHKMPAEAWEVTLDHGHHVAGVLTFPAHMQGAVEGATVVFTDPGGGPEASVSWKASE